MLSFRTVVPDTLELLKKLAAEPEMAQEMPKMFIPDQWEEMKKVIIEAVKEYQK